MKHIKEIIKEYMEISVKNDDQLIKMAAIVQRLSSGAANTGDGGLFPYMSAVPSSPLLSTLFPVTAISAAIKISELAKEYDLKSKGISRLYFY